MLKRVGFVDLPRHASGGFDHGDIYTATGEVFVTHTANNTVEIIDGERLTHLASISGCEEASGVPCNQDEGRVYAAAKQTGRIIVIQASGGRVIQEMVVVSRPNGLAWDSLRKHLLVGDVGDNSARIVDPYSQRLLATVPLRGRPRWCVYDPGLDFFLVNIREPSGLLAISAETAREVFFVPISVVGAHGLDIEKGGSRAFVACDGKAVAVLDLRNIREVATIPIAGEPDAIWHDPRKDKLYCAIGEPGLVDVVNTRGLRVEEQIETETGAHTMAFDKFRQRLYVFLPKNCRVSAYQEETT